MPRSLDQDSDHRNAPRPKNPAALPSLGVLLVVAASAIYGWWQNGNPPLAPQPGRVVHDAQNTDGVANSNASPIITPAQRDTKSAATKPHPQTAPATSQIEITPAKSSKSPQTKPQPPPPSKDSNQSRPTHIPQVTLKNQDGRVIYQGPIDLQPTIDRIEKGQRADHRNDGTVFQNREGRLPRKPSGYYHEYVVPTPDQRGPGPQRLILGKGGEVFYTADHYRSFRKIDVKVATP